MADLAEVTGNIRATILRMIDELGFEALDAGDSGAVDFITLGHRDDWPLAYRAAADLVDAKGAGHLNVVVGEASADFPPKAEQIRLTGASCTEATSADGEVLITCSWVSPDQDSDVTTHRVIRILPSGVFVDATSSNQDSKSSSRSRIEPPLDINALQKIVGQEVV